MAPRLTQEADAARGNALVVYAHPREDSLAVALRDAACRGLREADVVVFVFPQWWFGMSAILKGFVDRVFVPGVAFELDPEGGRLVPLLDRLKAFYVVTTTGSPRWVAELVMRNPVRRQISIGIRRFCSRTARFRMRSLYDLDRASREKCAAFVARVERDFSAL